MTSRSRVTTLETGNAADATASSRGWFVGDLAAWAAERGESFDPSSTPRQSADVQVKWFVHPPGHARAGWAHPDGCYSLCILVDGDMRCDFRSVEPAERSVLLASRGDYVIWHGPSWAHTWRTERGCTVVTVRWEAAR
ncbi:MAG TPA: hypothetical protein VFP90_02375 [Gemmatimonadaceae bacterium]|nr:hypothetical protein [Gemmatimonadaceae bacterium]